MTSPRRAQAGLVRGCCLLVVLLAGVLGFAAFVAQRAWSDPNVGPSPTGPDHGGTEAAIAVTLGVQLAAELLAQPHGVVTLSEHDLTVLAQEHNPHPNSLQNLTARVRDGLVVLEADHPFGPFTVKPVAHLSLTLASVTTDPLVATQLVELDVGALTLPGFIRDRMVGSLTPSFSMNLLFSGSGALVAVRPNLECVVVARDGVRIGVHRPGTPPDPSVCGS